MVFIAHVVSVERSNTAYNSLHIVCIGFMSCSLCSYVCFGLPGPAHPPKVKYSLKLLLWLALSARMCVLACQDQYTLPKWNILSSCYCGLLSLLVCVYWPSRTSTPSQSEIFSQSYFCCLLSLLVCVYWPSRTSTPSQSEIFSQICYCGLFYVFAFQDQHTLPKWSYLYIFMVFIAHVVSVKRSKTAYNSLHIEYEWHNVLSVERCILNRYRNGTMSWVSKDQTQHTIVYT